MSDRFNKHPEDALHPDAEFNDIGNAERFANFFWGRIAYVPELGAWRRWTGKRWIDDDDEAMRNTQVVARSWFDDLARESLTRSAARASIACGRCLRLQGRAVSPCHCGSGIPTRCC